MDDLVTRADPGPSPPNTPLGFARGRARKLMPDVDGECSRPEGEKPNSPSRPESFCSFWKYFSAWVRICTTVRVGICRNATKRQRCERKAGTPRKRVAYSGDTAGGAPASARERGKIRDAKPETEAEYAACNRKCGRGRGQGGSQPRRDRTTCCAPSWRSVSTRDRELGGPPQTRRALPLSIALQYTQCPHQDSETVPRCHKSRRVKFEKLL